MMHLLVNALAVSAGGGLTYIRNLVPQLAGRPDLRVTIVTTPAVKDELEQHGNIEFLKLDIPPARRFWYEQAKLPELIRNHNASVLLSTGNFALRRSPVPQILLSRNSIYLSDDFYRDLWRRGEFRMWLDTHFRAVLAKRSIRWADATVAPSQAFAEELRRWAGRSIVAIHHGFDLEAFTSDPAPLSPEVESKLRGTDGSLRLLFVSHYNYYRNFETLIRSLPRLRNRLGSRPIRLLLTCKLRAGENPGSYRPNEAANLSKKLGVSDLVVELGSIPYQHLHQLYRQTDLYVTPAYTETFAHPLVEAMASGVPVVASDLAVHREICGDAAAYFPKFSPETLADTIFQAALSPERLRALSANGLQRSKQFSWAAHVDSILTLCRTLLGARSSAITHAVVEI